jgi:hypothetical protein
MKSPTALAKPHPRVPFSHQGTLGDLGGMILDRTMEERINPMMDDVL